MSGEQGGSTGGRAPEAGAVALSSRLTIPEVVAVARDGARVEPFAGAARERVEASRATVLEALARPGDRIYGITTGYGSLAGTRIAPRDAARLSWNLILKCAAGLGPPLPADWVRGMLLARANSVARGASGVRPVIIDTLIAMLNRGVTPVVPGKGSLGASGDLAPLAHMAAVATSGVGEDADPFSGEAWFDGCRTDGATAMAAAGIARPALEAKEGLALTNGTAMMVAGAALQLHDARRLLLHAELAAALSFEGLLACSAALDPALHEANNQPGQVATAARLRALLAGSGLVDSDPDRVQDAYSLRCTPQIVGPVHDMLGFLWARVEGALNAVSDNPLVFPAAGSAPGAVLSGGNFHGAGPALWLDTLGIAMADVASLSDRRVFRMLTPELSGGLPAMLVAEPGLHGGLMSLQYTGAALVSDNKTLAHPRLRRLDPDEREPGGPREHGGERGPTRARDPRQHAGGPRDRTAERGAGPCTSGRAGMSAWGRGRAPSTRRCGRAYPPWLRTVRWRPTWNGWRSRSRTGDWSGRRPPHWASSGLRHPAEAREPAQPGVAPLRAERERGS